MRSRDLVDMPHDSADLRFRKAARSRGWGQLGHQTEAALTCQPDAGKETTSGIGVAEKNNNFRGNDQKERDLAYGDLCLRLHPP